MCKKKYSNNEALALIIASTRTRKRPVSICDVATAIKVASDAAGSLNILADQIGLSSNMLRQFMQVDELTPSVRHLVNERKIDSVDAVSHIAKLQTLDQEAVAHELTKGNWDTSDVRAFCELRASRPDAKINELIREIQSSKSIQEFVFEFMRRQGISEEGVGIRLGRFIDGETIKKIYFEGSKGSLVLNKCGRDKLFEIAKNNSIPVRDIVSYLLY